MGNAASADGFSCFLRTRFRTHRFARLFLYEYFLYSLRQAIHCAYKV